MNFLYVLESIRTPVLDAVFSAFTFFGSEWFLIGAAVIVFWCVKKTDGYYLMAVGIVGTVLNQFLKILCQIPRPWVRDPDFTIVESARADAGGYSFPSGHAQNVTGIGGGIARSAKRKAVRWICVALIVLVSFSRMYLGVHTPADVGAALAMGAALVFGLYPLFRKSAEKPRYITIVFAAATALALFAALYVDLRPWAADVDGENLTEAVKNLYTMLGCAAGVLIASPIERRYIRFETKAPWWAQILKVVSGLAVVVALRAGLKAPLLALFGGHGAAHAVRYCIVVLFAVLVWPLTFPWFSRGCPLRRRTR